MKSTTAMAGVVVAVGVFCGACEQDEVPDYGAIRIDNGWNQPVFLFLDEELQLTVEPGLRGGARAGNGLRQISIRDAAGEELFSQLAEIPANTFAEYIVLENGQVVATAGNIRRPDVVGGSDEQIKTENLAEFPVDLFVNNVLLATVAPLGNATVEIPGEFLTVSLRRTNGKVLFEQSLKVPNNAVIHYTVLQDGTVIATGEPIQRNIDIDPIKNLRVP